VVFFMFADCDEFTVNPASTYSPNVGEVGFSEVRPLV
jgi:hypothetical protein